MNLFLNKFIFLYYPYIVLVVFFCGSIYRYEYDQYSWRSGSSQILEKNLLYWGSNLFHFGIIFLMFGHFFGLMTPKFLYSMIISPKKKTNFSDVGWWCSRRFLSYWFGHFNL